MPNLNSDDSMLLDASFDDVDAVCERVVGWNLELVQLERGRFQGRLRQWLDGQTFISRARFRKRLSQRGYSPGGRVTLAVPAAADFDVRYRGQPTCASDIMIFPHDGELDTVSSATFDVYTISLPLAPGAGRKDGAPLADMLADAEGRVYPCSPDAIGVLRRALQRSESTAFDARVPPADPASIETLAMEALHTGLSPTAPHQPEADRRRTIRSALEFMNRRLARTIRMADLCQATGVSERTLQYAFQAEFGLSPMSYLAMKRLHRVRRELLQSTASHASIAAVARSCGLRHGGRFAAEYHATFGEYPSDTVRRKPG